MVRGAGKTEDGLVRYNEKVNKLGDDLRELYETIRVNVDEEEQWKVFDFVEDFFMEELEIGDYINDINSYHLHMFDKHDVTTKKFDAIVEKAGKVDANYAAQIEGYCSLLGEYGKKFEAVCAMLQPEKLRLSPDKYREKLEGINTGYQNAKDTHEQEQSAYEAELYEIETVWYKKMLDKAEDYLIRSAECIVLGNFTDEVTVLGVGVQIVLGIFDLDLPCDIRDIIADIKNLAETDRVRWDLIGMLALDLIGLIPVIGALKYSDEIGTLFKNADKVSVVARSTDGAGVLAKHADEAGAWLQGVKVFRYSDETAEAVASGEKLLKESQTVYESFADMMSPDDAAKYLDFLENGSREGLTSAELAEALLVSQKVGYEDVWDLRNVGDALESGSKGGTSTVQKVFTDNPFDEAGNLKPNIKYQTGEFKYNYETDANGRISNWNTDNLQLTERDGRLNYNSDSLGKIEGDHAGHIEGDRFGGSPELDNIVSQSQNVNLSQYKKIENQWAKAISEGKEVTVNIDIKYDGDGFRPIEFNVEYTIDGDFFSQSILN